MLRDGVKVPIKKKDGSEEIETIKVIDFNNPDKNDFFLASQFWVTGEMYKRRAALVGFINGLPLILIELKAVHKKLENAYKDNLTDYKDTIPQIFWYNSFIILSNGAESRVGTITADYEHFNEWEKISSEGEEGIVSIETIIKGTCEKRRLLDILENFILYQDTGGALNKIIAKYHQYLGVNNVIESFRSIKENQRNVFTLIHKFGDIRESVSDRSDIIVITDEAHRTQYDLLALNMRTALPKAAFIAFTGTPLMVGEKLTKKTFGDYISIYNFKQSVDDKATVPLYYENRIPEVQLKNEDLNEDLESIIEEAMLSKSILSILSFIKGRKFFFRANIHALAFFLIEPERQSYGQKDLYNDEAN